MSSFSRLRAAVLTTVVLLAGVTHAEPLLLTAAPKNVLRYSFELPGAPFVSLAHRYISEAPSSLQFDLSQGDYNLFDLRVGFSIDRFQLAIFAANITDEAGVTSATFVPQIAENRQYLLRPRTVGLTLDWKM